MTRKTRTETQQVAAALGTILSIWAHPDDETFCAGGLMAAARDNGQRVVSVSLTAGEHGTDDPVEWPPERLASRRRWESAAAMAVLGVDEHHVLSFPDGALAACPPEHGISTVTQLIDEVEPDTVLTFGPDGLTFHPDHRAVSTWVDVAVSRRTRPPVVLHAAYAAEHLEQFAAVYEVWGVYMTEERPRGCSAEELAVDIRLDGADLDRKLVALEAMASQTRAAVELLGPSTFADDVRVEAFVRRTMAEGP